MDAPSVRRRTAWLPLLVGLALLTAVLEWWAGRTLAAGLMIALVPVAVGIWLASRRPMTRLRWVVVALLVVVVAPTLAFVSVVLGCSGTTGGPSCWWDDIPWMIRDFIRSVWSTLTRTPMTRDMFPF
jgi:hypothetical protein